MVALENRREIESNRKEGYQMADRLREFMELCGYTDEEEIKQDTPRLEKALERARMTLADIDHGIDEMKRVYRSDLELVSVRKMMGVWLKKFIALMLCRDERKKVIYHIHPGVPRHVLMMNYASEDIYCDFPDSCFFMMAGQLLNILPRYLEMGEKHGMPPARAHCGINLLEVGLMAEGIIPKPDLLIVGSYQCDQSHKTAELLSERHKIPLVKADAVSDDPWGVFPDIYEESCKYFGESYDEMLRKSAETIGIELTEEVINKARHTYARLWRNLDEIHRVIIDAEIRPVGFASSWFFEWAVLEPDRIMVEAGIPALELHRDELKERVAQGLGVLEKGAPRIALKCGMGGDMSVGPLLEDCGLNAVVPLNATFLDWWEKQPVPETLRGESLGTRIAAGYLRKGYVRGGEHHVWRIREQAREVGADGLLFTPVYQCRCFAGLPVIVKQEVEKELGIPALYLETGAFDARDHSYEAMKTRVETFAELLRARKEAAAST